VKTPSKDQLTAQLQSPSRAQPGSNQVVKKGIRRRSFLRGLGLTGAALLPGSGLLVHNANAVPNDDGGGKLTKGDASILRFLATAEIIESDFWEQYWELGGMQLPDFAAPDPSTGKKPTPTGGNAAYTTALQILDMDMPQYILDNTDDEFAHANFLLAYLKSKGANTSDIDLLIGHNFRTLQGSTATGVDKTKIGKRLTNLTQLTIDTSFWGLYRTDDANPDLGGKGFAQAVPTLNVGRHTAIPRTDADTMNPDLIKAIAFTAGFHFPFIEIHGTSLYPQLAQRVKDPEVLRVVLSIGPTEAMHFQTWQDKAGNATPVTVFDPINHSMVTFKDLTANTDEHLQANLIMPEPCPFLNQSLPLCSIVRPTATKGAAQAAVDTLTGNGLFMGQTQEFMQLLHDLASDADVAPR
jgi:hypothetical protein